MRRTIGLGKENRRVVQWPRNKVVEKDMPRFCVVGWLLAALGLVAANDVAAQETLKLAVGQRSLWDTSVSELGQRAGIFRKHGLVLDLLYTQGAGETQQ